MSWAAVELHRETDRETGVPGLRSRRSRRSRRWAGSGKWDEASCGRCLCRAFRLPSRRWRRWRQADLFDGVAGARCLFRPKISESVAFDREHNAMQTDSKYYCRRRYSVVHGFAQVRHILAEVWCLFHSAKKKKLWGHLQLKPLRRCVVPTNLKFDKKATPAALRPKTALQQ